MFSGRSQRQDRRQFNESTRVSDLRRFRARPSRFRRNAEGIGQRFQRNLVQGDERHGAEVQMVEKRQKLLQRQKLFLLLCLFLIFLTISIWPPSVH